MSPYSKTISAVLADDERLLREQLKTRLASAWPELQILGEARDGNDALAKADELRPDVMFLDIRMPGMTGIEAAREILALPDWQGEIVFVTAYDEYAVAAFEQGAIDYLLKPVEPERLVQTAPRVKARLAQRVTPPPPHADPRTAAATRCAAVRAEPSQCDRQPGSHCGRDTRRHRSPARSHPRARR